MTTDIKLSEREFLITYTLKIFNGHYNKDFQPQDFTIKSITPSYDSTHGYEIYTKRTNDYLRIRLYFNITADSKVRLIRLEQEANNYLPGINGDEIYVILSDMPSYFTDNLIYYFRWIKEEVDNYDGVFTFMDGSYFQLMDETFLAAMGDS